MKILLFNTNNAAGGATKACYRLHEAYLQLHHDSKVIIRDEPPAGIPEIYNIYDWYEKKMAGRSLPQKAWDKMKDVLRVNGSYMHFKDELEYQQRLLRQRPESLEVFTFSNAVYDITEHPLYKWADVIHLHWVADHFFDFRMFDKIDKPVVWTLHDTNPFTGGCHYTEGCVRFQKRCAPCPQLKGTANENYAGTMMTRNEAFARNADVEKVAIVAPSQWLKKLSASSRILGRFNHYCIPYSVDETVFRMKDRHAIRDTLGISPDQKVILFAAYSVANKRKGLDHLLAALARLPHTENLMLLTVGAGSSALPNMSLETRHQGMIKEETRMSDLYNAADVFVIPSLEDNLPNTVIESLMCGTAVVGFPIGGIPDMIRQRHNGLLCEDVSVEALSMAIQTFMAEGVQWSRDLIATNARQLYARDVQVQAYLKLYSELSNAG